MTTTPPKPLPQWFWKWAAWDLGKAEYRGHRRDPKLRASTGAPPKIPTWAFTEKNRRWPHHPATPPVPTSIPSTKSPSKGRGVLYYYNAVNSRHAIVNNARRHGLAVALLVHEGADIVEDKHNPPGLREELQAAGVPVIATGFARPDGDYAKVADAIARATQGYDEYMANVENAWGYGTPGFGESEKFVPAIRAVTSIHLSVAIENREPLHFAPWIDAGLEVVRPECYMNEQAWQTPLMALTAARQFQADLPGGLRPDQVEPLLGKYGDFQQPVATWRGEVVLGLDAGIRCTGLWAAEFGDDVDVAELAGMRR